MKVILMMALTADGKIGKTSDHLANWTSGADKKIFIEETKKAGVIIMGWNTYQTIGRPLPGRLNIILSDKKDNPQDIPGQLEFSSHQPKEMLEELKKRGFETVILGGGATVNGHYLLANLIDELWLTIEPKIFGSGLPLFSGADVNLNLELIENRKLDKNVIQLRYKVIKP